MSLDHFGDNISLFASMRTSESARTAFNMQEVVSRNGSPTLNIEIAPLNLNGVGGNWSSKITIQLTKSELMNMCRFLFGLTGTLKGNYHGDKNNKGFTLYDNGPKGVAFILSEKGRQLQHYISPEDRIELGVFALRRLSFLWKIAPSDTLAVLRQSTSLLGS